jgi:hypothetical protein
LHVRIISGRTQHNGTHSSATDEPDSNTAEEIHQANETLKVALEQYTDALDRHEWYTNIN